MPQDTVVAARMRGGLLDSDHLADEVVLAFSQLPGGAGWRLLDLALSDGLDAVPEAPPALRAMLAPILDPPDWVNWDLVNAGTVAYWRAGPANAFGGALSLGYGYPIPRVAKVLLGTGRIDEMAGKRLLETGRWLHAVTDPDNTRPDLPGSGIEATIRVRLVHAYVRKHMLEQDDWDTELDGLPLNVSDIAATLNIAFFTLHVEGVKKLGIHYSPGELEAMAHMWRWIGHVLGVEDMLLPVSYEHARRIHEIYEALGQRTDAVSGTILTTALVRHGLPQVVFGLPASRDNDLGRLTAPFTGALLAYMLGPDAARLVGLDGNPLTTLMRAAPFAGRAFNLVRASGLLGSDTTIAATHHALANRLLANAGAPKSTVHPEAAVTESRAGVAAAA